jgi:hypothetical protein
MLAAGLTGLNHISLTDGRVEMKIIPVDFTVNTIISAAYKRASQTNDNCVSFYNSTTSSTNPTTWRDFTQYSLTAGRIFPIHEKLVLYPNAYITKNVVIYSILFTLLQILPSLFFDLILVLSGQKAL